MDGEIEDFPAWRVEYLKQVQAIIDEHGWFSQGVMAGEHSPVYEYTVGLKQAYAHPELIVFGLKDNILHSIVCIIVDRIKSGKQFKDGDLLAEVINNFQLAMCSVPKSRYADYVGVALDYNRGWDFDLLQVVWPDRAGILPWEEGFDESLRGAQPILCGDSDDPTEQMVEARLKGYDGGDLP